jgi:hypothetical protein
LLGHILTEGAAQKSRRKIGDFKVNAHSILRSVVLATAVISWPAAAWSQTNYYAGTVAGQSPVGYWRLDETTGTTATATVGGSGLDGTYFNFGGANPGLDQEGPRPATIPGFTSDNVAKQFNGSGTTAYTRVEVADQAALDITGALTISAWINPTSFGNTNRGIVAKWRLQLPGNTSVSERAYGFNVNAEGKLQFVLSDNGSFNSNFQLTGNTTVSLNQWQHVTAVYQPGVAMQIWRNGVGDGQKTTNLPASIANTVAPLWIGQQAQLAGQPTAFIGRIDEPAVFNAALSAQAIRTQYTAGVFSGTSTWKTAGSGAWGSGHATAWTSGTFNGSEVNAAPGTFAGVTNADTAIFGNAATSGTATISLDGAAASLRTLTFSNTSARYRIVPPAGEWPAPGLLVFLPDGPKAEAPTRPGRAVFGTDGRFTAGAFTDDDGLLPGRYRVIVQCGEPIGDDDAPSVSHVPARYGSPATTDLTLDVPATSRGVEMVFSLRP